MDRSPTFLERGDEKLWTGPSALSLRRTRTIYGAGALGAWVIPLDPLRLGPFPTRCLADLRVQFGRDFSVAVNVRRVTASTGTEASYGAELLVDLSYHFRATMASISTGQATEASARGPVSSAQPIILRGYSFGSTR